MDTEQKQDINQDIKDEIDVKNLLINIEENGKTKTIKFFIFDRYMRIDWFYLYLKDPWNHSFKQAFLSSVPDTCKPLETVLVKNCMQFRFVLREENVDDGKVRYGYAEYFPNVFDKTVQRVDTWFGEEESGKVDTEIHQYI